MLKRIVLIVLPWWGLVSCDQEVVLSERMEMPPSGWHLDSAVTVTFEPKDSTEPVFMSMYLRHTADYPYNNLYLFRTIESTHGMEYSDTVNVSLANALGKWNGSGMSNVKTMQIPIGSGAVRFLGDNRYTLRIVHGMRDTLLPEILDVGIRFERATSEE